MSTIPKTPKISDTVLEEFLKDNEKMDDRLEPDRIFKAIKKRVTD